MKIDYWSNLDENCCYHIYNRTVGKELLFNRDENWDYFMRKWWQYIGPYTSTYAYCLLPNHFHFLIKIKKLTAASKELIRAENTIKANQFLEGKITLNDFLVDQFSRLFKSYTGAFNKENQRHGSLFQSKFKRVFVKNQGQFDYLLFYIHHNPIHHKLVKDYGEWSRCSYNLILEEGETNLAKEVVLKSFADENDKTGRYNFVLRHEQFKEHFNENLNSEDYLNRE